jgi:hypothetical protein
MDVKIVKSDNGSLSVPNNIQFHPPDELFPDATRRGSSFSHHIPSPYVDEAVKKGMDSERQCKTRRSSTQIIRMVDEIEYYLEQKENHYRI